MKYKGNVTGSCEGSNFTEFPINNPQFRIKKKKRPRVYSRSIQDIFEAYSYTVFYVFDGLAVFFIYILDVFTLVYKSYTTYVIFKILKKEMRVCQLKM